MPTSCCCDSPPAAAGEVDRLLDFRKGFGLDVQLGVTVESTRPCGMCVASNVVEGYGIGVDTEFVKDSGVHGDDGGHSIERFSGVNRVGEELVDEAILRC